MEEEIPLSWFHFKVDGIIQAFYKNKKILLSKMKYNVMYEGDLKVLVIELIATFDPQSLAILAEYEPLVKATNFEKNTFKLKMKEDVLKTYNSELIKAISATELMTAGKSVCLKFENFVFEKAFENAMTI